MSSLTASLRSLWFGDGLTSATTLESGRNSDTSVTIRETTHALQKRADVRAIKLVARDWDRLCRKFTAKQAQAGCAVNEYGRIHGALLRACRSRPSAPVVNIGSCDGPK